MYHAFYLPGPHQLKTDETVTLGLKWLLAQSGEPLILLHAKKMVRNNRFVDAAAQRYRIPVEAPVTIWKSGFARDWDGGTILAPWASDKVLDFIDDDLADKGEAVCVIGWSEGQHDIWIARPRSLRSFEVADRWPSRRTTSLAIPSFGSPWTKPSGS